jgi:SSS family solute:Na+ symporter
MNLHLGLLVLYSGGIIALGIWTARLVRGSSEFFVAGRSLGPGLILASMLAANIGAGSTVGATGLAYRDGLSAWWWVGSAGLGSLVFAFFVAPRLWRLARDHDFYTTGDYLEHRYSPSVRGVATVLVGLGSLALLAGQLIAGAAILNVVTGLPRWAGALAGGTIMTVYFTAGGLLGSAWINTLQLVVMVGGFLVALPVALGSVGGIGALTGGPAPPWFGDVMYSSGPDSGWVLLALTGPSFIVSPGLIQKAYGGSSAGAVRLGVALNAAALLAFAFVPVVFGMIARVQFPGISDPNAVLPTVLTEGLPPWLGAVALAAVFSTEVDTCDAILFMLSSSASKDVYKRFINPGASDRQLLRVGRATAVAGGAIGVALSMVLATVIAAVTVFYSLLVVTLFVPIIGGLYWRRAGATAALAAMGAGVATLFAVRLFGPAGSAWLNPTLSGIVVAAVAYGLAAQVPNSKHRRRGGGVRHGGGRDLR